jgi:3-hydroxyacyl-[acyl-carrier-protein] dehydratase
MSTQGHLQQALAALPHAHPFRFVSSLTLLEPRVRAHGSWNITGDEAFFAGHFPQEPIVPGVLIAEALAQLSGLVAFSHLPGAQARPARLAHVDIKLRAALAPPVTIDLVSTFIRELGPLLMFSVQATSQGQPAADGNLVLAMAQ